MDALASRPPSVLRVVRGRNFFPYFAGNLLSNCGTWFQNIAQAILIYRLTGSTFLVGLVNFSQFAGVVLVAPWAGAAADRFDRRKLLVLTQLASLAVTGALAILVGGGVVHPALVIVLALLLGLATAYATPAMQALVVDLVSRQELPAAVTLNSLTFNLARAVGPVLGAFVVARLGVAAAFGINSVSYLALIAGLAAVHPRRHTDRPGERPRLRESLRVVRQDATLVALLAAIAAISLSFDPVSTLTPGFASRIFHRPDTLTGYLVGAAGTGAVIAALTVGGRTRDPLRRLPLTCLVMTSGLVGFAVAPNLPFAYAALAVAGFGFLLTNTSATTAVQLEVTDEQRGRVMALWSLCFLGSRPIGSLVDGALASAVSLRGAALIMASPVAVAAAGLLSLFLRRQGKSATAAEGA